MTSSTSPVQHIRRLHDLVVAQHQSQRDTDSVSRVTRMLSHVKGIGVVQGAANGAKGNRYFIVDGPSWREALRQRGGDAYPSLVMVDEDELFACLESQVSVPGAPPSTLSPERTRSDD